MLISLLLLTSPAIAGPTAPPTHTDPAVQVTFNDDGKFAYGDRAQVYVRPDHDGYVIVLRSDARGVVRVLSPVAPRDDQLVRGGKKYEAKDRDGRETFVAEDTSGQGTVLAAWSTTPFDLSRFDDNGHWDLQALGATPSGRSRTTDDPESRLLDIVNEMKPDGHFAYDVTTYLVSNPVVIRAPYAYGGYWYPYAWGPGWWGYGPLWSRPIVAPRVVLVPDRVVVRRFR